jgi:hypothetical protein
MTGVLAQVVECQPNKHKTLSLNPSTAKYRTLSLHD